jgi:hypothetical protein
MHSSNSSHFINVPDSVKNGSKGNSHPAFSSAALLLQNLPLGTKQARQGTNIQRLNGYTEFDSPHPATRHD